MANTLEVHLEQRCCQLVRSRGGYALKLLGLAGLPDRIILMPGARVAFVEFKRSPRKATALQLMWLKRFRTLGFPSAVIYTYGDFEERLDQLCATTQNKHARK